MKSTPALIVIIILTLSLPLASAQISPDNFEKSVTGGGSFNIYFGIFNDKNETLFYFVESPHVDDWKIDVEPQSGIIEPGSAAHVKATFTAPRVSMKHKWYIDLKVELYNNTGIVESKTIEVAINFKMNVYEGAYFGIPFPEEWGYWGSFLNALIFWIVAGVATFIILYIMKRAVKATKTKIDDILLRIVHGPAVIWIITYGVYTSVLLFPLSNDVFGFLYTAYSIITILIITWIIYRIFRDLIIHYAFRYREKLGKMEAALISAIEKVGVATILGISGIMILQELGVDVTVLLASMGVLGIILGFAAQDTMANFFSGIHILLDRSIEIGDYVLLEGDSNVYRVRDVGLRSTKLYDIFANTVIYIPNNIIANHKIINLSRPDDRLEVRIDVGVSYNSDVRKVKKALYEVAMENPDVLKEGDYKPNVVFTEFGASSLNFRLYVWIDNLKNQWKVMSNLRESIVDKFREMNIEIPYQQVDIHIKK